MDLKTTITNTRTCRRFDESERLSIDQIEQLIELARLSGSARNCQPWQYMPIVDHPTCDLIFPYLGWAGYLTDWQGPEQGERPSAYILCLLNHEWLKGSEKEAYFDLGIASQNLLLGATDAGLLGCRIGAFSPKITHLFRLPAQTSLELVIALGHPREQIVLEECTGEEIKYWRDEQQIHHVPKRSLRDVIVQLDRV